MAEPCPFCNQPIVREYGSFRCKHCARSSEDLLDMERKARAAAARKAAREVAPRKAKEDLAHAGKPVPGAPVTKSARLKAVALAHARLAQKKGGGAVAVAPAPRASKRRMADD